jgi:hypothetical protein
MASRIAYRFFNSAISNFRALPTNIISIPQPTKALSNYMTAVARTPHAPQWPLDLPALKSVRQVKAIPKPHTSSTKSFWTLDTKEKAIDYALSTFGGLVVAPIALVGAVRYSDWENERLQRTWPHHHAKEEASPVRSTPMWGY